MLEPSIGAKIPEVLRIWVVATCVVDAQEDNPELQIMVHRIFRLDSGAGSVDQHRLLGGGSFGLVEDPFFISAP